MRISAKADYAVRAAIELARADGAVVKGDVIATAQKIPVHFLENILSELRHAGMVRSRRGTEGGYWLDKPAAEITVADIIRSVEGPLATVRGEAAENLDYGDRDEDLRKVWIALRGNVRAVLEGVSLADLVAGQLPASVEQITDSHEVWKGR